MLPLFQTSDSMLAVILVIVAFAFWSQRFKFFKMIGPALCVIIIGILLVNLHIVPGYTDIYGTISTYCIPFSVKCGFETDYENVETATAFHCVRSILCQCCGCDIWCDIWQQHG